MHFWPRMPVFPIIIELGGVALAANSAAECSKLLNPLLSSLPEGQYYVVDSKAEGFTLYPEQAVISAMSVKKRWTKAEVINLYNSRRAHGQLEYSTASLGNKPFGRVVKEIAALLGQQP